MPKTNQQSKRGRPKAGSHVETTIPMYLNQTFMELVEEHRYHGETDVSAQNRLVKKWLVERLEEMASRSKSQ